jgi:predicted nuclease of predicted toxin-antitoxin system
MGLDRALDRHLLDVALQEERVVITADTDFPQLLALSGDASPGVILFRSGDFSTGELIDLLARVLNAIPEAALAHSVCVVDRQRIRCRPLPLR